MKCPCYLRACFSQTNVRDLRLRFEKVEGMYCQCIVGSKNKDEQLICDFVFTYTIVRFSHLCFRTPVDFASASDKIWPHFAAMGMRRTTRSELVQMGVLRPVSNCLIINLRYIPVLQVPVYGQSFMGNMIY